MGAAAVPFLVKGGAALAGSILGKKLGGPNAEQKAGMAASQQSQQQLGTAGTSLMQSAGNFNRQGSGYLGQAGQYYSNLLGSRGAQRSAMAPEIGSAIDYYKGAGNQVNRTLRGGSRDFANAELSRQKAGQLSMLPAIARSRAAEGLGNVGSQFGQMGASAAGQGVYAHGMASTAGSQLFNQGTQIGNQQQAAGNKIGGLIFDLFNATGFGKKKAASSGGGPWGPLNV